MIDATEETKKDQVFFQKYIQESFYEMSIEHAFLFFLNSI